MGVGRRGDHDRLRPIDGRLDAVAGRGSDRLRGLDRSFAFDIGYEQLRYAFRLGEESRVELADPPRAEQGEPHAAASASDCIRRAKSSTRRLTAALSEGGFQVVSCSTMSQPS